jgi:hypothetical protein
VTRWSVSVLKTENMSCVRDNNNQHRIPNPPNKILDKSVPCRVRYCTSRRMSSPSDKRKRYYVTHQVGVKRYSIPSSSNLASKHSVELVRFFLMQQKPGCISRRKTCCDTSQNISMEAISSAGGDSDRLPVLYHCYRYIMLLGDDELGHDTDWGWRCTRTVWKAQEKRRLLGVGRNIPLHHESFPSCLLLLHTLCLTILLMHQL